MDDVSGATRVQNHLTTLAREEFLARLRADARITVRLRECVASIGLPAIERDIADFLDRVARRFGLSRRADLVRATRPPHTPIEDLLPEWDSLQGRLYTAYDRADEVLEAVGAYVCDAWQMPWGWLVCRLTNDMFEQAFARALGIRFVHQRASYLNDDLYGGFVPHVTFPGFETIHGESLDEAIQRRMDAAHEDCNTLRAMALTGPGDLPKGRLRKDQESNTRRNVRWLYEERVCQKKKYEIAKVHHAERPDKKDHLRPFTKCSCYQNVKDGIEDAQRLLGGMSPYFFRPR
jgi:hypothetical protein